MKMYPLFLIFYTTVIGCKSQVVDTKTRSNFENILTENGYHFRYKTEDTERIEDGTLENGVIIVRGSYNFMGTDGKRYLVNFVADKYGYRPQVRTVSVKVPFVSSAALASLTGGGLG